jgi:hypothetical protein
MTSNLYHVSHYTDHTVEKTCFLYALVNDIPIDFGSLEESLGSGFHFRG